MDKAPSRMRPDRLKGWLKTYLQGPMLFQLCLYWILIVVLVILFINYPAGLPEWRFYATVLSLIALLILNIAYIKPNPVVPPEGRTVQDWTFLIFSAALVLFAVWMSGADEVIYLLSMVCAQACIKRGVWPGGVVFGAAILLVWLGYQILNGASLTTILAVESALATGIVSVLLLMTLLNRYMRQTKRAEALLQELQAANTALEAAQQKEKELAVAEERVRLARDIHDGLGHHLTVLSIQLQAAAKLVDRNPQAAAQAIQTCRSEVQAALEEVRHSVGFLRQSAAERQPLSETLASLVQSYGQNAGVRASFDCRGAPVETSSFTWETLYRAVQEGLTNVQKHAKNVQQVSVCLSYEPEFIRLVILDDGQGPEAGLASSPPGFGLIGLRERVAQLGGEFTSSASKTGGFEIGICIPYQGKENDPGTVGR